METGYTSIGTTCRSDPVNSMDLLYPNGFNRNGNRSQTPLVQVRDTADDGDNFVEYDFDYLSGSPSENVTVTIKFSSKTDSVVAETSNPRAEDKEPSSHDDDSLQDTDNGNKTIPLCLTKETKRNDLKLHLECNSGNNADNGTVVNDQSIGACAIDPVDTNVIVEEIEPSGREHDSLFDEYEKMVKPVRPERTRKNRIKQNQSNTLPCNEQDSGSSVSVNENALSGQGGEQHLYDEEDKDTKIENTATDIRLKTAVKKPKIENTATDIRLKTAVKKPADVTPDIRFEMVSPITKTKIIVERSPSDEDDGEDFMNYLKELRQTSPVSTETEEECLDTAINELQETDSKLRTSATEIIGLNEELFIVEIDDFITENMQREISPNVSEPPSDNNSIAGDVIEISDEENCGNESVIIVSDDDTNGAGLLDFNFSSLNSITRKQDTKQSIERCIDCLVSDGDSNSNMYSVIEIESDYNSDTDGEDEQKETSEEDTNKSDNNRKYDKDDGNEDKDKGNGSSNSSSGNNQNSAEPKNDNNGHEQGNGDDNGDTYDNNSSSGNNTFSPGIRSRIFDSSNTLEDGCDITIVDLNQYACLQEEEYSTTEDVKGDYSPEDIEVHQILDVSEKQSDIKSQFQTIDSYCFDTPSDISDVQSTSDQNSTTSHSTTLSKCLVKPEHSPAMSNNISSRASTSSFDVFAESNSNLSDAQSDDGSYVYENVINAPMHSNSGFCENAIHEVCAKIQNLYLCKEVRDSPELQTAADYISITPDSESDSVDDADMACVFESAIEEQFWANTAECSLESSGSDDSPSDYESDDGMNNYTDKVHGYNEKETDSEYESVDDDENDENDFVMADGIDFDFMQEIQNRIMEDSEESRTSTVIQNSKVSNEIEVSPASHMLDTNTYEASVKSTDSYTQERKEEILNETLNGERINTADYSNQFDTENEYQGWTYRDMLTTAMNKTPRTLSYQVPYFKESVVIPVNHKLMKKLKIICKRRQIVLHKMLPKSADYKSDIDKATMKGVDESIKHLKDELDCETKNKFVTYENAKMTHENEKPKAGDAVRLGYGFYIFGTGDTLNLPVGPRLKQKSTTKEDIMKASVYFRGIPGIINNAYKMSNPFPKLGNTNESASHKILHACNRLATPQSPGKSKAKPETKHGMMQQEVSRDELDENEDTDSSSASEMYEILLSAKDLLNLSRFEDAQTTFLKLYNEIQEKPDNNGRLLVETLTGLADICIRQSRMCRSNPLEWQWLCMHAIALLQYTVEYAESELENQLDNELIDWYQEHKQSAELKCRPLEDAFNRAIYNCLKHDANAFDPFQSFSLPNTPVSQGRKANLFPLSSTMPQYLVMPGMSYRVTDKGLTRHSSDDSNVAVDWLAKFQHYCKDRLTNKDSKGVTEKILKSNSSKADDDTESILSAGSNGSLDWDHSDLQGIDEITVEITDQESSPENDYTFEYEIVTSDTEKEGWDFFINQRRNCNFESVVQMAVDGEKGEERHREMRTMTKETRDIFQHEKTERAKKKVIEAREIISPLHEHSISLTLARLFCRLADKLVQEEEYKKAEAVYEKILDIIDHIQDGTAGMLRFSARIMKNLGTVKSKQGKSSSGLVLLNKALHTYRDLQEEEANFEIAIALIELGNGYIVGKNHEDSVFNDVIIAICDFFEKDAGDSQTASTSSAGSASQLSQMTSSLGSNNEDRNVEEAVTCYTEAIALLDGYEANEKQCDMFAKAVMRLGDCYFMQNDYDKALECFEKSLTMFRANNMFGKDSLMENAHVLCMLGVSSFMLHVYPRAASVFEMALHMVRCAYGYKRTFLNGMLQSLAGITYYKMKNYHKCVSMCYQAYETYCEIFGGEEMSRLDKQKFWLVCQTLYVMGNSYNILNLQAKAMKYLTIARSLMKSSKCRERRQFMRVLQILGDAYFAQYDYKTALQFYNEALEYGECESQISFDEVFDPNCASDEMTIHNHLVSKSAEAHLSMQQYQNAVHYLEQAHDMQEVMGEDIKEDLINTLNQLGYMHSVSGDVNKAIEAYKECLEVFREIHKGELEPEMCTTLGNLAAMCYVKACIAEDPREERNMTAAAEDFFQDAMKLETNTEVCVKYGNYLYSQCKYEEAVFHLNNALSNNDRMTTDIVYGGLEKVTLPDLLQDEVDTQEEICLPSSCLARYLLILCHKAMHQARDADINLVGLMDEVYDYDVPLLHSVLGYAMMELMLFDEAAVCFLNATENEDDYQLACENYCICLLVLMQKLLTTAIDNIWLYYRDRLKPVAF